MEQIITFLKTNPVALIIFLVLMLFLVISIIRKLIKLLIPVIILIMVFLGYLYFTGQQIPKSKEELLHQGKVFIEKIKTSGWEQTEDFFKSEEWNNLKENISNQINEAAKKGKDELELQLSKVKEKASELFKENPEIMDKVKSYADSLAHLKKEDI